jgi:ketosteroid isomerase-like protein
MLALAAAVALAVSSPAAGARAADEALAKACASRDADAFRALLDPEALFGGPAGFAEGPDAVLARWGPFFEPGGPKLEWAPDGGGESASGDLAYTVGRWRSDAKDATGAPRVTEGRYLTVWRRAEGGYRALVDVALLAPAPADAARTVVRTVRSKAGDLEVTAGTFAREGGVRGLWVTVRRLGPDGAWRTEVETELPGRR